MKKEYIVIDDTNLDLYLKEMPEVPEEVEREIKARCDKRMEEYLERTGKRNEEEKLAIA